ncbi:hypothetical protein CHCC20442_4318 [Bacillus licheniformis]|uniref:hypothetical protein n=1 Tax=Bacillus licheniformis TaxID=1402 RepID=UPI0011A76A98|nr:hypothetical protein [Bacillus licheniformis]TWK08605.1 hypothetical protein CHCC20442_4318 [Bacillus licheniformis]
MFSWEKDAGERIDKATKKYEDHFGESFPLYEYLDLTSDDEFDFSKEGAKRLEIFINKRIKDDKPVHVPPDYHERLY